MTTQTKAGIVTIVGPPNAGKSTFLNRVIGQKLSITSDKPQTTRNRIAGIRTDHRSQMIFLDTPGFLTPRSELQRSLRGVALAALRDADVILYFADSTLGPPRALEEAADLTGAPRGPVITVLTKIDLLGSDQRDALSQLVPHASGVSARTGEGVDDLLARALSYLPDSPFLYPEDELSTQTLRFFAAELVRESALERLDAEVPHSIAVEIEEYRESQSPVYIRAVIHVERESQRPIIIGAKGERIRQIGRDARVKIESMLGAPVYLDLWVKTLPNWRRDTRALRRLGFLPSEDHEL
jgi:GTP-binding protein Era